MTNYADTDILQWVYEESRTDSGGTGITPVQLLIVRVSLSHRGDDKALTQSIELSLDAFDRINLYRILRHLYQKGLIELLSPQGVSMEKEILLRELSEQSFLGCVALTPKGTEEALRLIKIKERG